MEIRSSGQGYICIKKITQNYKHVLVRQCHTYTYEAVLLWGELLNGTAKPHCELRDVNIAGCFHAHLVADCFML